MVTSSKCLFEKKNITVKIITQTKFKKCNFTLFNPSTDLKIIKANPLERPVAGSVFKLMLVISPYWTKCSFNSSANKIKILLLSF